MRERVTSERVDASGVVVIARTRENMRPTGEVYVVNGLAAIKQKAREGQILNDIDGRWVSSTVESG